MYERGIRMKKDNDLGKDPILPLVLKIAIPSMFAQFVSVLYSLVDRMYVGNIAGVGSLALAGIGICGPIVTMIGSVAFWIGVGGAPILSIRMGEERHDSAQGILSNCFLMLVIFSFTLFVIIWPLQEPMLHLFGASDIVYPYAKAYFQIYLLGTLFALLSTGMNQFIIAQGYAMQGMLSVVMGAVCNIVFDPLFIFVFNLGVQGAAIATIISQMISSIYVCWFLLRKSQISLTFKDYDYNIMKQVLLIGFAPFLIIAIDNVMIITMNAVLQKYGGDIFVTCYAIVQSFMLVLTMPLSGISGGTQSILSYNYGACQSQRVLQAQRYIILLCIGFSAFMFLFAQFGSPLFISCFTQNVQVQTLAYQSIRISTLAVIPLGIQYAIVDGFTAMAQVRFSLVLSFWRKLVYFIAVFVLPLYFQAEYIFYAETISDILGPIVSILVYIFSMKRILDLREKRR